MKNVSSVRLAGYVLMLLVLTAGCDMGQPDANQPPDTQFFVEEIPLPDSLRLNTVVSLYWLGSDPDGYVKGYELSVDGGEWLYTTSTDSTFRFDLTDGNELDDIMVQVRAVDNLGLADPEPAELLVPIRNRPPDASFDDSPGIPDTVGPVFSFTWTVTDLEGDFTLDSIFLKLNEGAWYAFSPDVEFVTLLADEPAVSGEQFARVYVGGQADELAAKISGLINGGSNQLFLQARDISGSMSEVDSSRIFFVKNQNSDLLVINGHGRAAASNTTRAVLDAVATDGYDWLDIRDNLPSFWDPTFTLYLQLYGRIYWFDDGTPIAGQGDVYLLEQAANSFQAYLNNGGKLMVSTTFSTVFDNAARQAQSLIFDFSPADSLSSAPGQARIPRGGPLAGVGIFSEQDTLFKDNLSLLTGADPFYPKNPENVLFEADLVEVGGWTGPNTVAARSTFTNNETNQVFFSVELHLFNGDIDALESLFDRVLNDEFNW